ncbi:hypothetical protein EIK77_010437 [Talaromyces pinophilus]|nr:hypothetical protein EIK77_010437 [Talaromyces pinophilus]
MGNGSVGTLVSYNHYIWYGKVSGTFKTSRDAGVITAFILLSDAKDEIDYEFIGANLTTAQTNYYFQGILDYDNEINATIDSDSFENYHTYEIDWTPDAVTWYLDGKSVRVLNKDQTYNATTKQFMFPQTPSRLELSLWPGGLASNAPGTIEWAGGEIDWNSQDMQDPGYYYAIFSNVSITCYDPPSGANVQGNNAYIYTNSALTNNTVQIVNNSTVLANFADTGLNMTAGASTSTASAASSSSTVADSIPGQSGGDAAHGAGDSSSSSTNTATSSGASATSTGFNQGSGSGTTKTGTASANENMFQSSIFAVLVAVVALVAL